MPPPAEENRFSILYSLIEQVKDSEIATLDVATFGKGPDVDRDWDGGAGAYPKKQKKHVDEPLCIRVKIENHETTALYDPGATMNFVHPRFIKKNNLSTTRVTVRSLTNVDGSTNKTGKVDQELRGRMKIGAHTSKDRFAVADIGRYDVIIGRHFLRRHDPQVEWKEHEADRLVFSSAYCSKNCLPFPADVYGETNQSKWKDVAALEAIPEKLLQEICTAWLEIGASESHSARIAAKGPQEERPVEELVPPELHEYLDVFKPKDDGTLPPHRPYDCKIDLEDGKTPAFKPLYNMSRDELHALKEYLDENLKKGFIKPSKSPARAPVTFVKKKDGSLRLCVDYRDLNSKTVKDRYPLPLPQEIIDRVRGSKCFAALDLFGAYNLLRVAAGDQWKTAFGTRFGHYEYEVMPFGLSNAPAAFQRFMNDTFRDMLDHTVIIYLDDILIFADSKEELLEKLRKVLQRCRDANLYCKAKKCKFFVDEIDYLGYVISKDGIQMDRKKVEAILDWPVPKNVKDIQTLLGFCNFYRRFIMGYSKIVRPMNDLLGKDVKFNWGAEQQEALDELKKLFTNAPLLAWPDFDKPYMVETDSSDFARGAILSQTQEDGLLHPMAYSSKSLSSAEQGYNIYDKELLAIFKAFKEWRHYLQGANGPTTVYTDHLNLETYATTKIPNGRQKRWSSYMEHFDYKIHYRPGKFARPDALSRRPDHEPEGGVKPREPGILPKEKFAPIPLDVLAATLEDTELEEEIKTKTMTDMALQKIINNQPLPEKYEIVDDTLIHKGRICVPVDDDLRRKILQSRHDSVLAGHPGRMRTLELVRRDYTWDGMTKYINNYVDGCDLCQRTKPHNEKPTGTLQPLPPPTGNWTDITCDLITGLPKTAKGHNAIFTVVDRRTKRAHYLPTTDEVNAEGIADLFVDHVWKLHGLPERVYSDRGPQFNSKFLKRVYQRLQIEQRLSSAYHPQMDGQSERANQVIEQFLRLYTSHRQDDWDKYLSLGEFAYNNTVNASTKMTPFYADLGRHPKYTPKRLNSQGEEVPASDEYIRRRKQIEQELDAALRMAADEQKEYHDRKRTQEKPYEVGDKVWLSRKDPITGIEGVRTKRPSNKLEHRYFGPFPVLEAIGTRAYRLALPSTMKIHPVFHVSRLSRHREDVIPGRTTTPPPPVETEEGEEYEVDEVIDSRWTGRPKRFEYLIKWKGYGPADNTWEPLSNVEGSKEAIADFHSHHPTAAHPDHPPPGRRRS